MSEIEEVRAEALDASSRLAALEAEVSTKHAAAQEEVARLRIEQTNELKRFTEQRVGEASEVSASKLTPVLLQLDQLAGIAEGAKATAEASMRSTNEESAELRGMLRDGLKSCDNELEAARSADKRRYSTHVPTRGLLAMLACLPCWLTCHADLLAMLACLPC